MSIHPQPFASCAPFSMGNTVLRALLIAAICTVCASPVACAQTVRGQKTFGPKAGYVSRNNSATAGLVFDYAFGRHCTIAPELGIIFRNENTDGLVADINLHFPVALGSGKAEFYPLAGISFTSWSRHFKTEDKDVSTHTNLLGLNGGAGFGFFLTQTFKLSVEGRYTLARHYPSAQGVVTIAYVF